jgi:ABC-type antimicrobial peptide transport system ATPase subunit
VAWIRTVKEAEARGELKEEYKRAVKRAGKVFEILKIQSLKPEYVSASIKGLSQNNRSTLARAPGGQMRGAATQAMW